MYTLCDFIDYLLGAFVVALCGPQCGLVLPTSGALLVLQNIQHLSGQETDSIVAFLDILGDVMRLVLKASKNGMCQLIPHMKVAGVDTCCPQSPSILEAGH